MSRAKTAKGEQTPEQIRTARIAKIADSHTARDLAHALVVRLILDGTSAQIPAAMGILEALDAKG